MQFNDHFGDVVCGAADTWREIGDSHILPTPIDLYQVVEIIENC